MRQQVVLSEEQGDQEDIGATCYPSCWKESFPDFRPKMMATSFQVSAIFQAMSEGLSTYIICSSHKPVKLFLVLPFYIWGN